MDESPVLSIIMPVYNEELYLASCIESIINQTFSKWELIIVDDFSTDDSFSILCQFSIKDSRISVYRNREKGIIPALRLAFLETKGLMITRMDADDIMPPRKLEILHESLCALGPGNIVSGKVKYFSDSELRGGFRQYEKWINGQNYYENIYKECTLPSACWMSYKSDLLKIEAFTDSNYPEDYDLLFKFYQAKFNIQGIDKVLHLWRDHPERASRNDPNYADQNFFHLKVNAFKRIDHQQGMKLYLWGAGRKGKALARQLIKHNISFRWVTENEKKIGKHIYDILIEDTQLLRSKIDKQIITAISERNFQDNKSSILNEIHVEGNKYFHFC